LTTPKIDDINVIMDAIPIEQTKQRFDDGHILEIVIWKLPSPVPGSHHLFKYRLFYGYMGKRIVGFDNERGKGDHCHLDGVELPYTFLTPDKLVRDFKGEVANRRTKR
jgi:hypothetical protein